MPVPSAAGKPWEGRHWSDQGTQEWRDSLTDAELDEWHDWQETAEEAEQDDHWRAQDQRDKAYYDQIAQQVPTDKDAPAPSLEAPPPPPPPTGPTVQFVDDQGNGLDAIVNDQPIKIQVTVPRRAGETPPETVEATVSGTQTTLGIEHQGTETVTLRWTGNVSGPAVYRSDVLTIERGGGGAGSIGAAGFEITTGGMDGFYTNDGDVIQVGFGTTTTAVQVYTSVARLELALTMAAIGSAHEMYTNVLINLAGLEAQLAEATNVADKAEIQAKIDQLRGTAQQGVGLAQRAIKYVNTVDVLDHQKVAVARLYAGWLGLFRKPTVTETGEQQPPPFGPASVPDPREESMFVYDASQEAKEEVRRIMWSGLTQATIGGYRLLAQATLVAQIMTLAGTTEMGKPATFLDKWGAFWDLVTQGALMGAMIKWNHGNIVGQTTARIPRVKPVTDQPTAMNAPTGTPVTPEAAGMLRQAGFDAQVVVRAREVQVQVRLTSPDAMVPRAQGALPKSQDLKPKTIRDIDRQIGAPDGAVNGSPGLFEPRLPSRGNRTDIEWKQIQDRYQLRKDEWEGAIGDYTRGLVADGKFQLRDGMVVGPKGEIIAGDYDLFDITNLDGSPVSPQLYDAVVADLMAAPGFQAAHGAHMRWNPRADDPGYHIDFSTDLETSLQGLAKWQADRNIFRNIVARHQPGGEGMITFAPNRPPVITYAGEVVGPKLADLGITVPMTGTTGPNVFIRPTLYLATTQQLLDGRLPDGAGWEWARTYDWTAEVDWWTDQYNLIQTDSAPLFTAPQASPGMTPPIILTPGPAPGPGFNWKPIAIGGVLVGTLLVGGFVLLNQPGAGPGIALGSPTAAVPTQPDVPDPNMPPDFTQPPPLTQPPTAPTATQPDVPDPNMPPEIGWDQQTVTSLFNTTTNGLIAPPEQWVILSDATGDQFVFGTGFPAPGMVQPWIDLVGAAGFQAALDADQAAALSEAFPCGQTVGSVLVSCNQQMPMAEGDYAVVMTGWNAAYPDPFPETANCSWAIQTNTDDDLSTGFPDPPNGHPLTGSDVYHETLLFFSQTSNAPSNYNLATDYGAPPRSDTGTQYGNMPTLARVLTYTAGQPGVPMSILFIVPVDDFGPVFSAHGYCIGDTTDFRNTLAVDAIGHPSETGYPFYLPLVTAP